MKALLIVDLQNDFLPGGALAVPDGDQIIPIVNALQREFTTVVATKDWHPPNHVSFASQHGKQPGEVIQVKGGEQILWPDHCVQGSDGAQFHPALETQKIQKVFFKGSDPSIDSYSTFFDNSHLRSTGLEQYLRERGIDEIYIVGLATDYCVKYSSLDGLRLGFKVHVILDGCRGIELEPGDIEKAIEEMKEAGVDYSYFLGQGAQS